MLGQIVWLDQVVLLEQVDQVWFRLGQVREVLPQVVWLDQVVMLE